MGNTIRLSCFETEKDFFISSDARGMDKLYSLWEKATKKESSFYIVFAGQYTKIFVEWPEPGFQRCGNEKYYGMYIETSQSPKYGLYFKISGDIANIHIKLKRGFYELKTEFKVEWDRERTLLLMKSI